MIKRILVVFILSFIAITLSYKDINADEMNSNHQIYFSTTIEVPIEDGYGYIPDRIWVTRGEYSGYIFRLYYEITRDYTYLATYGGTLYRNVAPLRHETVIINE
ncbi:hypothetical protein [Aliicoccus persicus]|uniref:Uncharacterized protein n=1 Tax=Aliicoccus persicus TaxID=930138 RepID=A0A662Z0Y6_9STAP|nr:hypothetical protein [Aliicoccus persicus]SEV84034.1 hypothetical protein SAMN05192557_0392 [Aliicoccus persicus]